MFIWAYCGASSTDQTKPQWFETSPALVSF
jgi:hypothetical protein